MELLDGSGRENNDTVAERIQPNFYNKTYEVKKSQLELLIDKNKQEGLTDTHAYMDTALIGMFTHMQASRGFEMFGEIVAAKMVKELKRLDEGAIMLKKLIVAINPDVLSSSDK